MLSDGLEWWGRLGSGDRLCLVQATNRQSMARVGKKSGRASPALTSPGRVMTVDVDGMQETTATGDGGGIERQWTAMGTLQVSQACRSRLQSWSSREREGWVQELKLDRRASESLASRNLG